MLKDGDRAVPDPMDGGEGSKELGAEGRKRAELNQCP